MRVGVALQAGFAGRVDGEYGSEKLRFRIVGTKRSL